MVHFVAYDGGALELGMKSTFAAPVILCLLYVGAASRLAERFPPVSPDEVLVAVHGYNLLRGQGQRYSLYDDLFAPEVYPLRDAFLEVTRPVHDAWVGFWLYWHRTYTMARASSWLAGLIALALLFSIGRELGGSRLGLTTMALALSSPVFWAGSVLVRPDVPLLAWSLLILMFLQRRWDSGWKGFVIGLLTGLGIGIHPNILPVAFGLAVYRIVLRPESWLRGLVSGVLGLTVGALLVFGMINIPRFLLSRQTFQYEFVKLPILTWPWHPLRWAHSLLVTFWVGPTYYFKKDLVPGWTLSLVLNNTALLLALIVLGIIFLRQPPTSQYLRPARALGSGLLAAMLAMLLTIGRQEMLYALSPALFLWPLVGTSLLYDALPRNRLIRASRVLAIFLLAAGLAVFVSFVQQYHRLCKPTPAILAELQGRLPGDTARVAGPNVFWYAIPPNDFRDLGAMTLSHYYTGGRWNPSAWLGRWKPEILIVDPFFKRIFLADQDPARALTRLLGNPVHSLGVLDTGAAYGPLDIVQIKWPS